MFAQDQDIDYLVKLKKYWCLYINHVNSMDDLYLLLSGDRIDVLK